MSDSEEPGKYQVTNQQPVQGQIIGGDNTVTQNFLYPLFPYNPFSKRDRDTQNRESLLKRVRNHIEKRLQPFLPQDTWMELRLQEQPDALDNPLLSGAETDGTPSPASSITQIYDKYEQLLILGGPGAGKTTLLCYLARELVAQAQGNPHNPIPVVLYLSTWARQKRPSDALNTWIVDELWRLYGVSKQIGESWVKGNQLLLLLDGLDEVAREARTTCIEAINHYSENSKRLVVSCRTEEYRYLSPTLSLGGQAISILSLTPQEIENYISLRKGEAPELKNALKDVILAQTVRAPLILSLLLQVPQETIDRSAGSTPEEIKRDLLNSYVRKANLLDEEKHWLIFLARQMKEKKQDPFFLESMQPNWLPKNYWRAVYLSLMGALFGAIIGMICFTLLGAFIEGLSSLLDWFHPWSIDREITVPLAGLLLGGPIGGFIGLFIGLLCPLEQIAINPAEETNLSWQQKVPEIILFLVVAIAGELISLVSSPTILAQPPVLTFIQLTKRVSITAQPGGIVIWITYELINACIGGLIYTGNSLLFLSRKEIQRASLQGFCQSIWSCAKRGGMIGLIIGVFDTLFDGFLGGPIYYNVIKPLFQGGPFTFWGALIIGICSGILSWLVVGLLTIVSRERLDNSAGRVVNQGIWRSLRYSMLTFIGFWLAFWLIDQFVSGLDFRWIQGIIVGFAVGLIPGLMNGGAACIKHVVLRYILRRANCTRRNYTDFLDSMVVRHKPDSQDQRKESRNKSTNIQGRHKERRILQEIGGGYVFIYNPLLLDYFENLDDPISSPQQKTLLNGNDFPHQLMIRIIASIVLLVIVISLIPGGTYFVDKSLQNQFLRGKHFYTTSLEERNYDINVLGFIDESNLHDAIYVFKQQVTDSVRLYRYYNPQTGDHIYTTDNAERQRILRSGYIDESYGNPMYVFTSRFLAHGFGSGETHFVPHELYRFYNSLSNDHFYCTEDICTYRYPPVRYVSELEYNRIFIAKGPYLRSGQVAVRLYRLYHL